MKKTKKSERRSGSRGPRKEARTTRPRSGRGSARGGIPLGKNPVVGIVGGRGTLGRVFRRELEDAGIEVLISGRKPDGKKVLSNAALVRRADIVIVAVFLKDSVDVIRQLAPKLKSDQLFCDLTSLKAEPVAALLESKAEVVGLHPMFGETSSIAGKNIYACVARPKKWWPWLEKFLKSRGAKITKTTPESHDRAAVIHQNIPHLLSISFARLLEKRKISPEKLFEFASPSTRLELLTTGRLLKNDHEMYADISILNPQSRKAIRDFADQFEEIVAAVESGDRQKFVKIVDEAEKFFGEFGERAFRETNRIFDTEFATKSAAQNDDKIDPKKAIAILGPATQTELAADEWRAATQQKLASFWCSSTREVFEAVARGKTKFAFLPLENFSVGPVRETITKLFEAGGKIKIVGEISRPIAHALLGRTRNSKPQKIFAHPQAREQSQKFLQKNFPRVEIVETASTGESVARAAADRAALAIGPAEFAAKFGLKVLQKNIADNPNNRTRFVALAKKSNAKNRGDRTALAFYFPRDRAGLLAEALTIFGKFGVNLTRLESIPASIAGRFFFFTECEATTRSKKFRDALAEIRKTAEVVELGEF